MDENNNMAMQPEKSGSMGTLVAAVVILTIIVVGALYFWNQRANSEVNDEVLESITTQNSSDDTASIEADLDATDLENLDNELDESEFNAS